MGSIHIDKEAFDFIVVGGGTAGNVVAGRLAENPSVSVLVIEAGPGNPRDEDMITTPARAMELRNSKYDWVRNHSRACRCNSEHFAGYKATFIDRYDYTRVEKPHTRGKVLGGCSCLNYFTWVRGSHGSYDDWVEYGGKTWNWDGCEEYFDKPAHYHDDSRVYNPRLAKTGRKGPLDVAISDMVPELEEFRQALSKAWVSKGENLTENVYEGQVNGLVKCMNTIYKGVRSTSACFLDGKPNITVLAETQAKKILIDNGAAHGVLVVDKSGDELELKAKREIILSTGVFESPKMLMLSGVGQRAQLEQFGIECKVDSPNVGQNLRDHPIMPHVFKIKDGVGLDNHLLRSGYMKEAAVRSYQRDHSGPLHSGLLELVGFPRIDKRLKANAQYADLKKKNGNIDPFGPDNQPHFEIDFVPMFCDAFQWHILTPPSGDHLTVIVDLLKPISPPGEVRLKSGSYEDQPHINLNFFGDDMDLVVMREGVRFVDDILMNGEVMKDLVEGDYPWPMPRASDEAMNRAILERSQTGFHPCGTNRLSKDIKQGVVDSGLGVHGVKNLRVIDASTFPLIPDCRIQNVVYMVAEKGTDAIKADHKDLYP